MVAPPEVFAITIEKLEPSAPVISHLLPLITQPLAVFSAVVESKFGSAPAPGLGSVIANEDLISPRESGAKYFARCSGVAILCNNKMLPSSGAAQFIAVGPNRLRPDSSRITAWAT